MTSRERGKMQTDGQTSVFVEMEDCEPEWREEGCAVYWPARDGVRTT